MTMACRILQVDASSPYWYIVQERHAQSVRYQNDPNDYGHYFFFLALDINDSYLGGAVSDIGPERIGPTAGDTIGYLEDLFIEEHARRQGVASALLHALLLDAWHRGARHVRWGCDADNEAGVRFYRAFGCAMVPEWDPRDAPAEPYFTVVIQNPALNQQNVHCDLE